MSNSFWKTPDQKPKQEELVAWVDRNGMHAGRFDTCYNCFCACADYRADLRKVKKWCSLENLDDLIAQADKAKQDLEIARKALDWIGNNRLAENPVRVEQLRRHARNALEQIEHKE